MCIRDRGRVRGRLQLRAFEVERKNFCTSYIFWSWDMLLSIEDYLLIRKHYSFREKLGSIGDRVRNRGWYSNARLSNLFVTPYSLCEAERSPDTS